MEEEDPIGDILGDLGQFDDYEPQEVEKIEILLIGRNEIRGQFEQTLDMPDYEFYFVNDIKQAANLLLQHFFAIILLDVGTDMDLHTVSNVLRQNHAITRIIMIYEGKDFEEISELFNDGSFDSIITLPADNDQILKTVLQQEAQYQIQREVTKFVSEPPELSQASFLLLDPTLSFGDEDAPLNFVGVMIVVNSVPRYNILFEDALANDEVLFAAFLSSISSMGDELFQSEESLKEINFGGISVIFRFRDEFQIAFLVKNLTPHNVKKAEKRIDNVLKRIFPRYEKYLRTAGLSNKIADEMDLLFLQFDKVDETDEIEYQRQMEVQQQREFGQQCILLMSKPQELLNPLMKYLNDNSKLVENDYEVIPVEGIDETSNVIRENNVACVIIDKSAIDSSEQTGLFVMESIEELDPSVQIIYLSSDSDLDQFEIEMLNSGNIDYTHVRDVNRFKIFASIQDALKKSIRIKQEKAAGKTSQSKEGLAIAKAMLKDNLEAFESEERPALQGVMIAQNLGQSIEPIFSKFYEVDGELINMNAEMMAGLTLSLKQISGEMFTEQQSIDNMEVTGKTVFARFNADFLFIYFIKNVGPNTSQLIAKELDAVTMLYSEIIAESLGVLSATELEPIFSKIAFKTHESLTGLLETHQE